jgi:hypothetical protein
MSLIALNHLLKASSRAVAEKCLNITFLSRNEVGSEAVEMLQSLLTLENKEEAEEVSVYFFREK